jgi:hypothetical protein
MAKRISLPDRKAFLPAAGNLIKPNGQITTPAEILLLCLAALHLRFALPIG